MNHAHIVGLRRISKQKNQPCLDAFFFVFILR